MPGNERGERGELLREVLIFSAFALLCAVGAATVLLPEGSVEGPQGTSAPKSESAKQPTSQQPAP